MATTDRELFDIFDGVWITYDNIEYFRALCDHQLLINRCDDCGYWIYPHRDLCPQCWSRNVKLQPVSGKGTIYMYVLVHQGRTVEEGNYVEPFPSVAVELEEQPGLRYLSTVLGARREQIRVGQPVSMTWITRNGMPTPAFQIVDDEKSE